MFNSSPFDMNGTPEITIPKECDVVFVADMFKEDYAGGAELTTEALIDASPFTIFKLHSKDVNLKTLEEGHRKFWIFGNFSSLDMQLIPSIVANMSYAILEYDYKYCRYRSPEKHLNAEQKNCDCHNEINGKIVSAFYQGAKSLWWMSEKQMNHYLKLFPFLSEKASTVLSSVFDNNFFATVSQLEKSIKISRSLSGLF